MLYVLSVVDVIVLEDVGREEMVTAVLYVLLVVGVIVLENVVRIGIWVLDEMVVLLVTEGLLDLLSTFEGYLLVHSVSICGDVDTDG